MTVVTFLAFSAFLSSLFVVLPDEPSAIERTAAEELRDGIRRMTGESAKILSERGCTGSGMHLIQCLEENEPSI